MLKKRTRLIVLSVSAVLVTSGLFATVKYNNGVKIQKQKIVENNFLLAKAAQVKKVALAKQVEEAKKIELLKKAATDKKIAEDKLAAKKIADKKIADEKLRIANLNKGMTLDKALALAHKLHPGTNFKLSDGTEVPNDDAYFQFKLFNSDWTDPGSDWYFAVNKKTGLAYRHNSDNTMVRDLEDIYSVNNKIIVNYTVTNDVFTNYSYSNGTTFQFKVGDTLNMNATIINSTVRTMEMGPDNDIFLTSKENGNNFVFKMRKIGISDLEVIPNYGDWERAYVMHIVVTE